MGAADGMRDEKLIPEVQHMADPVIPLFNTHPRKQRKRSQASPLGASSQWHVGISICFLGVLVGTACPWCRKANAPRCVDFVGFIFNVCFPGGFSSLGGSPVPLDSKLGYVPAE